MPKEVAELIKEGADAAHTDEFGRTPLMLACENKHEAAAAELMEATKRVGALDVQPNTGGSRTALHMASYNGWAGTVAKLLALGADAALTDKDGCTALWLACKNKHEAAAAALMEPTQRGGVLDLQVAHEAG